MDILGRVGPVIGADQTENNIRLSRTSALVTSAAHARYAEAAMRGSLYVISTAGATATAFTGGAGGTPLLSIYNPLLSGVNLVLVGVGISSRVAASGAGTVSVALWGGVSAKPTGTLTAPTNMFSQVATKSSALAFVNTANTGSTATSLLLPLASYYWATAAGAFVAPSFFEVNGMIVVASGNILCLGASAALTSATYDVSFIWEEIPV